MNGADVQAVIVNIRLTSGDMSNPEDRKRIVALEEQLAAATKESGAGDFDGDEFGNGFCTIYMYSPSADRLFTVVQPVLKKFHAPAGSYLIKRYGKPGAKQERVDMGGAGKPNEDYLPACPPHRRFVLERPFRFVLTRS